MAARLSTNPEIQAIIARNAFTVTASVPMVLDLNRRYEDYRHRLANQWCEDHATDRWRRRICELRGNAVLDRVIFEFEDAADAAVLHDWLKARGW
ncbi:hypothetical protein FOHLNKBM_0502 [Methylobacterium longum]|nr:hypothetical protein FOHLNKBM_0502 [Methylobacterium longum]